MSFLTMPSLSNAIISSTPSNVPMTSAIALSKSFVRTGIWYFQFRFQKAKTYVVCAWIVWI